MATTTINASTQVWEDWAILEPTVPQFNKKGLPVQWKVQRNAEGTWRCHCPSYIFSGKGGVTRTCKHIRRCQEEIGETTATTVTAVVAKAKPVVKPVLPVKPTQLPTWDSAYAITTAMLDESRILVNDRQREQMVAVLAAKLVAFGAVPVRPVVAVKTTQQVVTVGVRRITFDD